MLVELAVLVEMQAILAQLAMQVIPVITVLPAMVVLVVLEVMLGAKAVMVVTIVLVKEDRPAVRAVMLAGRGAFMDVMVAAVLVVPAVHLAEAMAVQVV